MHGVVGTDERQYIQRPTEVVWRDEAPIGKLDLMVNIDFRMSTTSIYSDVVLPTATWYEKHDLNTTDMHPFIHPLTAAVDPVWESRSDWNIFRGIAEKFSELAPEVLGVEHDLVLSPIQHDTPGELAQAYEPKDWARGECEPVPGRTMPTVALVERNYPEVFRRFTSLGPALEKLGNGGKGITWNAEHEVELLGILNGRHPDSGRPRIDTDIDACETILMLAPETNGEVALKAWGEPEPVAGRLGPQEERQDHSAPGIQVADPLEDLRQSAPAGDRRLLRALHLRVRLAADRAGVAGPALRQAPLAADRGGDEQDRMVRQLGGHARRRVLQPRAGI